jgi:glutathione S-transferase
MKLYYVPRTRATRPRWMLEELGVPYQLVRLDPSKGETRTPEHLARHPLGHVPVLEDGDLRIFESVAICLHLADRFPDRGFAPPPGSPERALCYQWLFYAATEIEPPISIAGAEMRKPEAERDMRLVASQRERLARAVAPLEPALSGRTHLVGDRFSVADVVLGSMLLMAKARGAISGVPAVEAYMDRLEKRPARIRASAD